MGFMRAGRIVYVDLTTRNISYEQTDDYKDLFYGGHGINLKILYDRVAPKVKPLDPENLLIFGTGPYTGTMIPGSGRTSVASKSPMSGLMGRSNFGGFWAPELKYAGYDNLVISGKADRPVYVFIHNDTIEIRDATHLWGMDTYLTQTTIRDELKDQDAQIVCIGPGGENLVRYATIISRFGNGGGRTGMGCVMGSKNLKAIAVRGTKGINVADPHGFFEACMSAHERLRTDPHYAETIAGYDRYSYVGVGGEGNNVVGNFNKISHEDEQEVENGFSKLWENYGVKRIGCFNCPVRCMEYYSVPDIGSSVISCTIYSELTRGLDNVDAMRFYEMGSMCQRYGIDPTSAAGMISWATELYKNGIISKKDTDGIPMIVNSRKASVGMIEKIIKRKGFGDILAGTTKDAVKKIGKRSEYYMVSVKGMPPLHDNFIYHRDKAIALATGNRGDYVQGGWNEMEMDELINSLPELEGKWLLTALRKTLKKNGMRKSKRTMNNSNSKATMMAFQRKLESVTDMLLNCKWHSTWTLSKSMGIEHSAELLSIGEGRYHSPEDLFEAGERVQTLERAYNAREGLKRKDDKLPKRFFGKNLAGYTKDDVMTREEFEKMKDVYYETMGWETETGMPSAQLLDKLKMSDVVTDLKKRRKLPI